MFIEHHEFITVYVQGIERKDALTFWSDGSIRWYRWNENTKTWQLRFVERQGSK